MEKHKPTTSFILDTRRKKTGEVYPVKLRVIYNRKNHLYGTIFNLSSDDFEKVMGSRPRESFKDLRKKLDAVENKAIKIIEEMKVFSFDAFGEKFTGITGDPKNVFSAFDEYIAELKTQNRIGSAIAYSCALNSFKKYHSRNSISFSEIDVSFLKKFESWSTRQNNSLTTVGIYMRCLRSIYNRAIAEKLVMLEEYPFGRGKYEIPAPRNIKKALGMPDIKKIFEYETENETIRYYRDLWIFSYLCNGANIKDICLLRYSDISEDSITFRRAKTSSTNRNAKPITAAYTEHIRKIIEKWGTRPVAPNQFIFQILQSGDTELMIKDKVRQLVKQINKYMIEVASDCEITAKITTYTARHSFATVLKRSGISTSFIAEFLGHASEKTTEFYLGSIEDPERKKIAANLTNFD